jgi:hypothetical protein
MDKPEYVLIKVASIEKIANRIARLPWHEADGLMRLISECQPYAPPRDGAPDAPPEKAPPENGAQP